MSDRTRSVRPTGGHVGRRGGTHSGPPVADAAPDHWPYRSVDIHPYDIPWAMQKVPVLALVIGATVAFASSAAGQPALSRHAVTIDDILAEVEPPNREDVAFTPEG